MKDMIIPENMKLLHIVSGGLLDAVSTFSLITDSSGFCESDSFEVS